MNAEKLKEALSLRAKIESVEKRLDSVNHALRFFKKERADEVSGFEVAIIRKHTGRLEIPVDPSVVEDAVRTKEERLSSELEKLKKEFASL